jgi:hypothetical protein
MNVKIEARKPWADSISELERERRFTSTAEPQDTIRHEQAREVAKYLYGHGETDTRRLHIELGIYEPGKVKAVMTYMTFEFDGESWMLYEDDDGFTIGLTNSRGDTPKVAKKPEKRDKYIVSVDGKERYFRNMKEVCKYVGCNPNIASRMLNNSETFRGIENVEVTWAGKKR